MKKLFAVLLFSAAVFSFAPQGYAQQNTTPHKFALVIGNGNYTHITKLNNPVNDANDMAAALQVLGFTVDKVLNGSLDQMESAAIQLKNRLSAAKNSYGLLFYAGHGVQSGGENYLIPVDANIQSESFLRQRAVSVQALLDELNDAGNELNIMVLDACRDNPFSWRRSASRGLAVVGLQPADSIIVFATGAGSAALDGTGRNGLFTSYLLNHLNTPGLEVTEVFRRTMGDVSRVSGNQQRPAVYNQFSGLAYLGLAPAASASQSAPSSQSAAQSATVTPTATTARPVPHGFLLIHGGTFTMGSPAAESGRDDDETQRHITLSSFLMCRYEVTQAEYQELMGKNPSSFKGDNLPVDSVNWYDAVEYCNKRSQSEGLTPAYVIDGVNVRWDRTANGYRLPTEAEWEYACRAGTTTPFSTGNNITTNQANYNGSPYNNNAKGQNRQKTMPVFTFEPNPWGLHEMHGNVSEWCWDWYGDYITTAQTDPTGASFGTYRVIRGGSWNNSAAGARSALRNTIVPSYRYASVGFRLARNSSE